MVKEATVASHCFQLLLGAKAWLKESYQLLC